MVAEAGPGGGVLWYRYGAGVVSMWLVMVWMLADVSVTLSPYPYYPPKLDIRSPYVDVPYNSTVRITCHGRYPMSWNIPLSAENYSTVNESKVEDSQVSRPYVSVLELTQTSGEDTGRYTCFYKGTKDMGNPGNVTSVYVFVNDKDCPFKPDDYMLYFSMVAASHGDTVTLPCRSTFSYANVTLWKRVDSKRSELIPTGDYMTYDPTRGFIVKYIDSSFYTPLECRATINGSSVSSNKDCSNKFVITVTLLSRISSIIDVKINATFARDVALNSSFKLSCNARVDIAALSRIIWKYPVTDERRVILSSHTRRTEQLNTSFYVASRELTIVNVQKEDEGTYICEAFDHNNKSKSSSLYITVYEEQPKSYVNLTTDINTTVPYTVPAGTEFKLVVTIIAHPEDNLTLIWEKDGMPLESEGNFEMPRDGEKVKLVIKNVTFVDRGVYTLHGSTNGAHANLSLTLEVTSKPVVAIQSKKDYYKMDEPISVNCSVMGTPPLVVWWKKRNCTDVLSCAEHERWEEVNGTRIRTYDTAISSVYGETAEASGYYRCYATNDKGTVEKDIPIIVTEARNGFQMMASDQNPVEGDEVTLTCLANYFTFSSVEWKWSPKHLEEEVLLNGQLGNETYKLLNSSTENTHNLTMVFKGITLKDAGDFGCNGYYRDREDTMKRHRGFLGIAVKAIEKPNITLSNLNNNTLVEDLFAYLELKCSADGVPKPTITWHKDSKPLNISAMETNNNGSSLVLRRLAPKDAGFYQCTAENRGGAVSRNVTLRLKPMTTSSKLTTVQYVLMGVFIITGGVLLLLTYFFVKRVREDRKEKRELELLSKSLFDKGQVEIFNPELPLHDQIDLLPYDHRWEFPKERLKLGRTLGAGAFGRVVKADAIGLGENGTNLTVAVKTLKERADINQRKALMAELKILIHLGRHLNIVNVLGAVTKNVVKGELMVIVEYCRFGNLRHYLLRHREHFVNQVNPATGAVDPDVYYDPSSPGRIAHMPLSPGVSNPIYGQKMLKYAELLHSVSGENSVQQTAFSFSPRTSESDADHSHATHNSGGIMSGSFLKDHGDTREDPLTTCDLLCYAFQCARGMEYLASRKLIHRDLAARNVLLADDNIVKICDFGLAKDCYKYSNYVKKGDGLLPVKWTAIESITDRVSTIKSDVWSYGVLLWEIFSLGGNPYPGVEINEEFYRKLKNGYRMEMPEFCPNSVYDIMKECWLLEPKERPDFTCLVDKVGSLLESGVKRYYMELNDPYMEMNKVMKNNNDYLTMAGPEEEYLNMKSDDENYINTKAVQYDNVGNVRALNGGPVPKEPMEVVPMIQFLDNNSENTKNRSNKDDRLSSSIAADQEFVTFRANEENVNISLRPKATNSSGDFSLPESHSDYSGEESRATPPPAYNLVVSIDRQNGVPV